MSAWPVPGAVWEMVSPDGAANCTFRRRRIPEAFVPAARAERARADCCARPSP
ncbi:MAG TPA: hypothetical protein VMC83_28330 [Streptosporangiaceae bacterium]|nr:hypothetical protein [Streptosporangiaceae bacterium]